MSTAVLERPLATTSPAPAALAVGDRVELRRDLSHPTWVRAAQHGQPAEELVGHFRITASRDRRQYDTVGGMLIPIIRTEVHVDAGLWCDAETFEAVGPKHMIITPAPSQHERETR